MTVVLITAISLGIVGIMAEPSIYVYELIKRR